MTKVSCVHPSCSGTAVVLKLETKKPVKVEVGVRMHTTASPDIEIKADFAAVVKDKMKKVPVEAKVALLSVWRSCLTSAETCSREAENVRVGANHAHE